VGKFEHSERFGPRHPVLARMAFQAALPIAERFFVKKTFTGPPATWPIKSQKS